VAAGVRIITFLYGGHFQDSYLLHSVEIKSWLAHLSPLGSEEYNQADIFMYQCSILLNPLVQFVLFLCVDIT
jgi:hypothetical protein